MPRRIDDRAVDEYVEREQHARLDARRESPNWRLVEAQDGLGGMIWKETTVATRQELKHQIIRQAVQTPMGFAHKIECTCGKRLVMTNSLKSAQDAADAHLKAVGA